MGLKEDLMSSPLMQEMEAIAKSEKSLPDSEAKRHHFIPEFLLRRFADNKNGRERLCQLDIASGKPIWVDPGSAASRRRLYSLPHEEGGTHNLMEGFFSIVESHAAPAIQRLCETGKLDLADRSTIAFFVAFLEGRTLGGLERLERLGDQATKSFFASHAGDPDEYARTYREAIGEADRETIEQHRQWLIEALRDGHVRISDPKAFALDMLQHAAADTFQIIFQLHWELLEDEQTSFITSDRGMALHDPTPRFPWSGQAWLSSANSRGLVPLDPRHCLMLHPSPAGPGRQFDFRRAAKPVVEAINLCSYGYASEYIFSHSQEVATQVHRLARRRPKNVIRPKPNPTVVLIDAEPGDTRLADEHRKRGWPPQLMIRGAPHDYVVIDKDDKPVERSVQLTEIGKERAVRRLGSEDLRHRTEPLNPAHLD
jgi:Protein of unknown function (DUF4238)